MRWDGDGADVGDDVDDDLDDARDDDDDDGDGLPFREVISPAESARRRWLFSSVVFRLVEAAKLRNSSPSRVFTLGGSYRREGAPRGATRHPGGCLARPRGGARHTSGCLVGPFTPIFGGLPSFFIKIIPVNFHRIWSWSDSAT